MFKVGDLVIGNQYNNYAVTNKNSICRVIEVRSKFTIKVVVVKVLDDYAPAIKAMKEKMDFVVYALTFDLYARKKKNTSW